MDNWIISTALGSYIIATILQSFALMREHWLLRLGMIIFGLLAVCAHAVLLHLWIDVQAGQNLNFINLFSLTLWMLSLFVLVLALAKSVDILVLFTFPLAMLSIGLALWLPGQDIVQTAQQPDALFHILLAIVTFCVLCFAALLALLLAMQEWILHRKKPVFLVSTLPAVETMETLLFQVIGFGFVLLSVMLATSLYFYHGLVLHDHSLLQKAVLSLLAWVIFAILLSGRQIWGWRGRRAVYATLLGVTLLMLAYIGFKAMAGWM